MSSAKNPCNSNSLCAGKPDIPESAKKRLPLRNYKSPEIHLNKRSTDVTKSIRSAAGRKWFAEGLTWLYKRLLSLGNKVIMYKTTFKPSWEGNLWLRINWNVQTLRKIQSLKNENRSKVGVAEGPANPDRPGNWLGNFQALLHPSCFMFNNSSTRIWNPEDCGGRNCYT